MPTRTSRSTPADASIRICEVELSPLDDSRARREKLARIVLDQMVHFVGLLDPDGMILEMNRAALDGTGVHIEEVRGTPFWEGRWWPASSEARELHRSLVQRAGRGEFVRCDAEMHGRGASAETIVIDYSLQPVKDDDGKVVFLLPEGRDITEKKRDEGLIERQNVDLIRLLEQRQQLDQLKSDFFANPSLSTFGPFADLIGR